MVPWSRREIITVRGESPMSLVFQNIDPHPLLRSASVYTPPPLFGGEEDTLAGRRGGGGVNILEDERHRIALLQ
jgi:hypothetical protein